MLAWHYIAPRATALVITSASVALTHCNDVQESPDDADAVDASTPHDAISDVSVDPDAFDAIDDRSLDVEFFDVQGPEADASDRDGGAVSRDGSVDSSDATTCLSGVRRCVGNVSQICNSSGHWDETGLCTWGMPVRLAPSGSHNDLAATPQGT